ncbi:hypothetical protein [Marinomonas ostreistagni]|uniref:Uncharacterized protein n=1 Tax=Marinomonas ostreistagni TaxID=359209 RepID=A0ABS0Z751_9GAMM|nr:hypothetical protein [Marinomonas ostreistagni]MBJ7549492.1 hypothetical protein [Marinomonas ostreistagni]
MFRLYMTLLLIPLVMLFSITVKASSDGLAFGKIKGDLIESSYELPSAEVAPDIDHALTSKEQVPVNDVTLYIIPQHNCFAEVDLNRFVYCRAPPILS